ncbi:MAG: sugar-binding domain-containing protein [Holdemanella porci]
MVNLSDTLKIPLPQAALTLQKYTQEKDNVLCVRIFQKCTGTWLEDQDMWRFTGIFRDVMIYKQP